MKKLICLVLVFTMMLTACSKWSVEIVEPRETIEREAEITSDSEEISEELTPQQERADKYIFEYEFRYNEWMEELEKRGISVLFEDRKYIGDEIWEAKLVFEKENKKLAIPFNGIYAPAGEIYYGTVMFPNSKTAVFCGNRKAVFFSTETLEIMDFEPEFKDYGKENLWINGAGIDKKTGNKILFAIPLDTFQTEDSNVKILTFDEKGKFISEKESNLRGIARDGEKRNPFFYKKADMFDYEGKTFVHTGYEICDYEGGKMLNTGETVSVENDEYRLEIESVAFGEDSEYMHRYFAALYENGEMIRTMMFIEPNFTNPNYSEEPEDTSIAVNRDLVTLRSDVLAMTLILDFAKNSHSLEYAPDDMLIDMEQEPITSSDGKYSIYYFGRNGAGDITNYHLSLRDNETKKHTYLGQDGGMYGGYNGVGFLKNNDVYIFSGHRLEIFDPITAKVKFDINKNFPLGYDVETESERGLLTFRRDPKDFGYIVVYYEYENGVEWKEAELENIESYECLSCNYKIGFLDDEGKLLESYESNIPVAVSAFGIDEANMFYVEGEKLTIFVSDRKGHSIFTITFDLETKEFTVA